MKTRGIFNNPHLTRYSLPVLLLIVLVDIVLGYSGIISREHMKNFVYIPAILELIFITGCLMNIRKIVRRYRELKRAGKETVDAWQEALEVIITPQMARLVMIEPRLYHALYLSYRGKPNAGDALEFPARLNNYQFLLKAVIGLCFFEILLVSLMLPQQWMVWKIVHLILGLWAVLWLWADFRAMRLYCHEINDKGICFRIGLRYRGEAPWESIAFIGSIGKSAPGFSPQVLKQTPEILYLSVGEPCNVEVEFRTPQVFQGMIKEIKDVKRLYLSLENPESFLNAAKLPASNKGPASDPHFLSLFDTAMNTME